MFIYYIFNECEHVKINPINGSTHKHHVTENVSHLVLRFQILEENLTFSFGFYIKNQVL